MIGISFLDQTSRSCIELSRIGQIGLIFDQSVLIQSGMVNHTNDRFYKKP